ncbi:hypothetical protein OVA29_10945 [Exiguobacterium sp. SL14]|nr:hypothetical protein [Exiguobacterium sp. SL14]MCY1691130.1 hypothetical protein [Exiguobacterium sp. SL14]
MPHQRLFNVGLYVIFIFSAVVDYETYQRIGLSYALTVLAMVLASTAFVLLLVRTHHDPVWKGSWQLVLVLACDRRLYDLYIDHHGTTVLSWT